jgi:hypothetical protein
VTNLQLYIAIGLPTIAVLASMVVSLVQISSIREDIREIRGDTKELRRELNGKIDLLTGKVYELMAR